MRLLSHLAGWFSSIRPEEFMTLYTTTVGDTIYLPSDQGIGVCVHEHVHVRQSRKDMLYYVKYLLSSRARTYYEVEAFCASMEMEYYLTGALSSYEQYISALRQYECSVQDMDYARDKFIEAQDRIKKGVIETPESVAAIEWLDEYSGR